MLTPRLKLIASKASRGARIIDVGTDHAYVPIYLAEQGVAEAVLAADIKRGPLDRAEQNIRLYGMEDKVKTFLTDGLSGIDTRLYDTVIIAGMGGILISDIIKQTDNPDLTFILQPMTAAEELREFLYKHSFEIADEELVAEGQKLYTVIVAKKGTGQPFEEIDLHIGKKLLEKRDPLLGEYIKRQKNKLNVIINGLKKSADKKGITYYQKLLDKMEMTELDYKD